MSEFPSTSEQLAVFKRGAVDLINERELGERIERSRSKAVPMRIKFGMDPSSADLHVGHAVCLRKLRAIQELGHTVCLIVGDATAMVGDPSGRNKLRPQLTREQVELNLQSYVEQASLVLDFERTEVRRNGDWFHKMSFEEVLKLTSRMTVARMLERDTFQNRMRDSEPIGIHEFLYPLMQGWDSVEIKCDVELGGTDQLFNLLVGRNLQEQEGQPGQACLTMPLINGLDGRKMSKSYGNAIGLTDSSADRFGKTMAITDEAMEAWYCLLTDLTESEIAQLLAGHPREAKARLAREMVRNFSARATLEEREAEADQALAQFNKQFQKGELPADMPELAWPDPEAEQIALPNLLVLMKLCTTTSDARRMIKQGAVKADGTVLSNPKMLWHRTDQPAGQVVLQVGKRRFARLVRD